jgi:hypothetical protein
MLDPSNREDHYCGLAGKCRRLAVTSFSIQMSNRYWRMAEGYSVLAKAGEGLAYHSTAANRFKTPNGSRLAGGSIGLRRAKTVLQLRWRGPGGSRCLIP